MEASLHTHGETQRPRENNEDSRRDTQREKGHRDSRRARVTHGWPQRPTLTYTNPCTGTGSHGDTARRTEPQGDPRRGTETHGETTDGETSDLQSPTLSHGEPWRHTRTHREPRSLTTAWVTLTDLRKPETARTLTDGVLHKQTKNDDSGTSRANDNNDATTDKVRAYIVHAAKLVCDTTNI